VPRLQCDGQVLDPRGGAPDASGDDLFYETYLAPLETRMLRAAWRITRDPDRARDALQDALARVWKHRDRVRGHPNPSALVLRIVVQAAIDTLRRQRVRRRVEGAPEPEARAAATDASPAAAAERVELRSCVQAALARLPAKQAAAVTLRLLEEQPYAAIAAALGCAEATARVQVLRGRARLASLLRGLSPAQRSGGGET
jgi:RNA polymerase sigma-70 factor (ECF subfamily)